MSGSLHSARVRILSNYLRLFTTFAAGLLVIRLLAEVGASTLTVYMLLLSGSGFAYFFMVVIQESVIPLLGLSYEDNGGRNFAHFYWISLLLAVVASVVAVAIFSVIWAVSDLFDTGSIPKAVLGIAILSGALRTVATALAAPPLNALLLSGRIVFYNVIQAVERLIDLVAAVFVLVVLSGHGEVVQAEVFFLMSAALYLAVQAGVFFHARRIDRRFGIHPTRVGREDLRWVGVIFSWNCALVVAFLLYLRLSTFVMNIGFGEAATLVLGIVFLLIGYQRQIAMGLVIGLDAVIARVYGAPARGDQMGAGQDVNGLILRTTYVQGLFSFASIAVLWLLADPVFRYWLGDSLDGKGWSTEQAVLLFKIMSIGSLARSISESWMKLLSGRGLVGRFAPWVLAGGLVYAALLLWWAHSGVPLDQVLVRLAAAYSVLFFLVHLGCVPVVLARVQELPLAALARAALGPGLAGVLPLVATGELLGAGSSLAASAGTAVAVCLVAGWMLVSPAVIRFFVSARGSQA